MLEKSKNFISIVILLATILIGAKWFYYSTKKPETNQQVSTEVIKAKAEKPVPLEQVLCMAKNIYYEAASEPFEGKVAVARVVMNRISYGFASTPCNVIYQTTSLIENNVVKQVCQFSWVCEKVKPINKRSAAYKESEKIAREVLIHNAYAHVIPKNVLFFHRADLKTNFGHSYSKVIGNHIFYARRRY